MLISASATTGLDDAATQIMGLRAWIDNAESVCRIEFYSEDYSAHQFGIYDLLGKKIIAVEYHSHAGKNYLEIPMASGKFPSGIYFLKSSCGTCRAVKLFLH